MNLCPRQNRQQNLARLGSLESAVDYANLAESAIYSRIAVLRVELLIEVEADLERNGNDWDAWLGRFHPGIEPDGPYAYPIDLVSERARQIGTEIVLLYDLLGFCGEALGALSLWPDTLAYMQALRSDPRIKPGSPERDTRL